MSSSQIFKDSTITNRQNLLWCHFENDCTHRLKVSVNIVYNWCSAQWTLSYTHFCTAPPSTLLSLQRRQTKSDTHAVKYTTCLAHHSNMAHVTTHQLVAHGSRQGLIVEKGGTVWIVAHLDWGTLGEHRAMGNYEKQLQRPTDNTGTSTWRSPILPDFNVHMIMSCTEYWIAAQSSWVINVRKSDSSTILKHYDWKMYSKPFAYNFSQKR